MEDGGGKVATKKTALAPALIITAWGGWVGNAAFAD